MRVWKVHPPVRFDLRLRHFLLAFSASVFARDRALRQDELERQLGKDAVVCSSVRSGFELLLEALALPAGSEVLVSAITHPDMKRILRRHGLVAVPVDVDPDTLASPIELMEQARTSKTCGILVAHLFGAHSEIGAVARFARRHGLLVMEDCAQAYVGPGFHGHGEADVSMFSFGPIKTSSALGGAVLYVRAAQRRERMRTLRARWPQQARAEYLRRAAWFCLLYLLANAVVYGFLIRSAERLGVDTDRLARRVTQSTSDLDDAAFGRVLRRLPSAALLAVLANRLHRFDAKRLQRRTLFGDEVTRSLPNSLSHPGRGASKQTYWLFPIVSNDPGRLVGALRRAGFHASPANTSITALDIPPSCNATSATAAQHIMKTVVFVPTYPEIGRRALRRLIAALQQNASQ